VFLFLLIYAFLRKEKLLPIMKEAVLSALINNKAIVPEKRTIVEIPDSLS